MWRLDFAKTNSAARIRAAGARGALSHAMIFSGRGDALAAARYAAAAMECTGEGKPCLRCQSCRKVMQDIHPDVIFVRDEAHKELSAETVRAMRADAFIRPNEGARKVYIFENAALLTEKDQNILLKLVEEGPEYAAFLFCAENAAMLLKTLRSRCVELKLAEAQEEEARDERANTLAALILGGTRAERTACLARLEGEKCPREALSALFEQTRALLAEALLSRYGVSPRGEAPAPNGDALSKRRLLAVIELLQAYQDHCTYNVGVGPTLGGFAVELEESL